MATPPEDQPTDTPNDGGGDDDVSAVKDESTVEEPVVEEEQSPSVTDGVPRTPSEFRDAAAKTIDRAKAIGPKPFKEAAGSLVDRIFGAIDDFFDRWEKGEKKK